ncbi:MAG: DUF1508 domain-containing protein [Saprospiraceae bacterium]|nr:DUF1508 domain-containing protein [Saprospiraceae bacterium]
MKFEIFRHRGQFHFRLRAGNGRILLTSVGFSSKGSCIEALHDLQKSSRDGSRYERRKSGEKYQLFMKNHSGDLIASGSKYTSEASYLQGLYTISTFCSLAPVLDKRITEAE